MSEPVEKRAPLIRPNARSLCQAHCAGDVRWLGLIAWSVLMLAACKAAFALTPPPPPCAYEGTEVRGQEIVGSAREQNGFVTYSTEDAKMRLTVYLEHCPTGKTLRATSGPNSLPYSNPKSPGAMYDTLEAALWSKDAVSMREMQQRLQSQGIRTKRFTSKTESCACQAYYPEARGAKTSYQKVTQ